MPSRRLMLHTFVALLPSASVLAAMPATRRFAQLERGSRLLGTHCRSRAAIEAALSEAALDRLLTRQEARLVQSGGPPTRARLRDGIAADFRAGRHLDIGGIRCAELEVALAAVSNVRGAVER